MIGFLLVVLCLGSGCFGWALGVITGINIRGHSSKKREGRKPHG